MKRANLEQIAQHLDEIDRIAAVANAATTETLVSKILEELSGEVSSLQATVNKLLHEEPASA